MTPERPAANVKRGFTSADPQTTAAVANAAQDHGPCQRVGDDPSSAPRGASANSGDPLKGSGRERLAATLPHCDCRADDWIEGDEGAIRCVRCGGYASEPGTSIRMVEVSDDWTPEKRDLRYLDERDRRREGSWDD